LDKGLFCPAIIDFQIINFTRPEGGDNTSSISSTDNAVKLFYMEIYIWKSIALALCENIIILIGGGVFYDKCYS
jgi:hypothetical protein